MLKMLERIEAGLAWIGRQTAWAVPVLILSVCLTIAMAQMRWNSLWEWETDLLLFGKELTLAGLNDLQWHLFALFTMLGGIYALHDDRHVSVDLLSSRFSSRTQAIIRMLGDYFLLLPFAALMTYFSWKFFMTALGTGESSSYGGLADRWVVKSIMPIGFGALSLYAFSRATRTLIDLLSRSGRSNPMPPEQ